MAIDVWLPMMAQATAAANRLLPGSGLTVLIADGCADGQPGLHLPEAREIRLDPERLGTVPGDLRDEQWRSANAETLGVFEHELAHAAHTRWPSGATTAEMEAVRLLEEPRCEKRAVDEGSADRRNLRAAALQFAPAGASPAAAVLGLGRLDAGILLPKDCEGLRSAVADELGPFLLDELQSLWREFLGLGDDDFPGMLSVARRWCGLLPGPSGEGRPGKLRADESPLPAQLLSLRPPTAREAAEAAAVAEALSRERPETGRVLVDRPPGRLSGRAAARADAFEEMGIHRPVPMFSRIVHLPEEPVERTVAVMVDVSGSMEEVARKAASMAWTIAAGAAEAGAATTVVHFGERVRSSTGAPGAVAVFRSSDHWENFSAGFAAVDGVLAAGGDRMLVVITDAAFAREDQRSAARRAMADCRAAGVRVLWMAPEGARLSATYGYGTEVPPGTPMAAAVAAVPLPSITLG